LEVLGLTDGDPFFSFGDAIDDDFREAIWIQLDGMVDGSGWGLQCAWTVPASKNGVRRCILTTKTRSFLVSESEVGRRVLLSDSDTYMLLLRCRHAYYR
jgi:hypothetical protein